MTDTVYVAGNGPHIFQLPLGAGHTFETPASIDYDADPIYCPTALVMQDGGGMSLLNPFTPITEGWVHFEQITPSGTIGTARAAITLYNTIGTAVVRLQRSTGGLFSCERWNGAAWVAVCTMGRGGRHQVDIYFKVHASLGEIEFYYDKVSQGSFAGDTSALGSISWAGFQCADSDVTSSACVSQILVTNFNTLSCKVHQRLIDTNGEDQDWTGSYTDINEAVPNVASYTYTDTVDDVATYGYNGEDFDGYLVRAVIPQWSGLRGGPDAPPKWRPVLKINGTDYYGTAQNILFGNTSFTEVFHEDPATGLAWTRAAAGAPGRMALRSSTIAASATTSSLALPAGWQPNDIFLLLVESNTTQAFTAPDVSWTALGTPVDTGQTRLTAFWKRAAIGETNPLTIMDTGDHTGVVLFAFSGAVTTGDPWYDVQTSSDTAASTAITWPTVTPPSVNYGIINIIAHGTDSATRTISAITQPSIDTTTQASQWVSTTQNGGGGIDGYFALASSATGITSTGTASSTDHKALMSLVLTPRTSPLLEVGIQARS